MPELKPLPKKKKILGKICVIGELGVGKTQIIRRFTNKEFSNSHTATIAADTFSVETQDNKGQPVTLQFWDVAGDYSAFSVPTLFRSSDLIILVYAINKPQTLEKVVARYEQFCERFQAELQNFPVLLLGNKLDLYGKSEQIVSEESLEEAYARIKNACGHSHVTSLLVSAKAGDNFDALASYLSKLNHPNPASEPEKTAANRTDNGVVITFPKSYASMWHRQDEMEKKVFALLNDYTKNNSKFKRLFTFHLLRHHTKQVHATLVGLEQGDITFDQAIENLKALQPKVGGSLHKRLMFIDMNLSAEDSINAPATPV